MNATVGTLAVVLTFTVPPIILLYFLFYYFICLTARRDARKHVPRDAEAEA